MHILSARTPAHRYLASLPAHLQLLLHARLASSAAPRFPFPTHPHPTPHQIFHLPHGASQAAIKARYYDLVRVHHPDAPAGRALPPPLAHARFHAITGAYERLLHPRAAAAAAADVYAQELARRREQFFRREANKRRSAAARAGGRTERAGGRTERVLVALGIAGLGLALCAAAGVPVAAHERQHRAAARNLAQARREAREVGAARREAIRRRVRAWREGAGAGVEELRPEETGRARAPRRSV